MATNLSRIPPYIIPMKQPLLFLSASLMVLSLTLNAQNNFRPAYYVNLQHDTVFGEIDNRGDLRNCLVCTFRPEEGKESVQFEPGEIVAYRFSDGGKYYVSREVLINQEVQKVFLEFLVEGISNLYYYRGAGGGRYFLESADGTYTELSNDLVKLTINGTEYVRKSNLYVGQMKASFGDCPEIQAKLDKAQFSHNSLIKLTSEYHEYVCEDGVCIIYEKTVPVIQVSGGAYVGMIRSGLSFPKYEGTDQDFNFDASYKWYHYYTFSKETDLVVGMRLRFTLPRANEKLAVILLAEYSGADYEAYAEEQTSPGLLTQMKANAHLSTLNVMTGIQYSFPKGKIRPSLAIGPVFSVDLNSYFDIEHTLITGSQTIIQDYRTEPVKGMVLGGFSQLGVDWSVAGRHHLGSSLRYHLTWQRTNHYIHRDGLSISLYYNFLLGPGLR